MRSLKKPRSHRFVKNKVGGEFLKEIVPGENSMDVSIVMPCFNEENTVGKSIDEAKFFLERSGLTGEIIVVDNCSMDDSALVAYNHGARVISEPRRGYGRAIRTGIQHSLGKVIIIGDCDMTYDFADLDKLYQPIIQEKCDVVIGNRYTGGIEKGATSLTHKLGVRFLSMCGRMRFHTDVYDFHCGLRGISNKVANGLEFHADGMEFATEMIALAAQKQLRIMQVPVVLRKCNYRRSSKLRTIRDGMRHLAYIISFQKERNQQ